MDLRIGVTNAPKEITVELADDTDVDALRADVDRVVGGAHVHVGDPVGFG